MDQIDFKKRYTQISKDHLALLEKENTSVFSTNGIYNRYENPILTRDHIPLTWRFDMNPETNPFFMERIGFNAVFNAGAIKIDGKYLLLCRVEGNDRKSFFAVAESENGIEAMKNDQSFSLGQKIPIATKIFIKVRENFFFSQKTYLLALVGMIH